MRSLNLEEYVEFPIEHREDMLYMRRFLVEYDNDETKSYIAQEFATNMLEHGEKGRIKVNGREVVSEIYASNCYDEVCTKINEAKAFVLAKKSNPSLRRDSERGFAFISILLQNWDLLARQVSPDRVQVIALKCPA